MTFLERLRMLWLAIRGPKFAVGESYRLGDDNVHTVGGIHVTTSKTGVTYAYKVKREGEGNVTLSHYEGSMERVNE